MERRREGEKVVGLAAQNRLVGTKLDSSEGKRRAAARHAGNTLALKIGLGGRAKLARRGSDRGWSVAAKAGVLLH